MKSIVLILCLMMPSVCYGHDIIVKTSDDKIILNDILTSRNYTSFNSYNTKNRSLLNELTFKLDNYYYSENYNFEYVGIDGFIIDSLNKRIKNQAFSALNNEYNYGNMSDSEYNYKLYLLNENVNSDWQFRNWWEFLEHQKIKEIYYVGHNINVPKSMIPYWWVKNKIDSLGDIWIKSDDIDESQILNNYNGTIIKPKTINSFRNLNSSIDIDNNEWFKGKNYHFRVKPIIRFKPDSKFVVDEIIIKLQLEIFGWKMHVANLNFTARYDVSKNNLLFNLYLELVRL